MIAEFFSLFYGEAFLATLGFLIAIAPIWLPLFLAVTFWKLWFKWRRKQFILGKPKVLLEIKLSSEITRSPRAMESFFNGIHITSSEGNWWDIYVNGKCRNWFSFELVSIGGEIHFYIWCWERTRNAVEAQIYAQYPDVQILEVPIEEDYARQIAHIPGETQMWGANFSLTKADAYPIKTYVDYNLDKENIDQEEKVDAMASVFEFMSAIGPGEQIWLQILAQATKNKDRNQPGSGTFIKKKEGWKDAAEREIEKLKTKSVVERGEDGFGGFSNPTRGEADIITAIERSIAKQGFECGIRGVYWAEADKFDGGNIAGLINTFKHYSSNTLNGFKPDWVTDFDYPWEDYKGMRENYRDRIMLEQYRKRSWFHPPFKRPTYVLNTEELATIYHFPGSVVASPGLRRIEAKTADAPSNLPI